MSEELRRRADDSRILVLEERLSNFMEKTDDHRETLYCKLDSLTKLSEKTVEQITSMNNRCIEREANHQLLLQHLKEHRENNTFWRDKKVQAIIGIGVASWVAFMGFIKINFFGKTENGRTNHNISGNIKRN
jgi:hypothetical protein